ncbi:lamina-associated polypeptide 2, isoforms beta/gamma-like isoform X2 [Cololabis saira]|uniref:lamina-associated polypeptide 2, isoforms beta/gamma-like isoform X2 n=1 Tax=Cololabis saira TaxID=129043 RepID=UPI002AD21216|nr:lamina-associated polypeptide 2, isoforms beta/gamma-like isoform X2 [Cololabis saira]
MPFVEDPAHLSKSRLKSDLVAHHVQLPPAGSSKRAYLELHLKHIDHKYAADFSSDDDDQEVQDVTDRKDAGLPGPHSLTDDDLRASLLKYGVKAGPIVASTRALYERKLRKLLQSGGHDRLNGAEKTALYSDSEEEGNGANEEEGENESGAEQEQQEIVESNQSQKRSRERACPSRNKEPSSKWNSRNVLKSSEQTWSQCSQIPAGISRVFSISQRQGLGSGVPSGSQSFGPSDCTSLSTQAFSITQMVEEMESQSSPSTCINDECELISTDAVERASRSNRLDTQIVEQYRPMDQSLYYTPKVSAHALEVKATADPSNDILKDIFPDTKTTPTGIYATCRRPIKGAAQRPIKYLYPDTPVSPVTLERRELERRLVPIKLQILVFFIVACILYLIYIHVEDSNIVLTLLATLTQWSDSVDWLGFLFHDEAQDRRAIGEE